MLSRLLRSSRISQHAAVPCCNSPPVLSLHPRTALEQLCACFSLLLCTRLPLTPQRARSAAASASQEAQEPLARSVLKRFSFLAVSLHDVSRFFAATSLTGLTRRCVYGVPSRYAPLDRFSPSASHQCRLYSRIRLSNPRCPRRLIALQVDLIRIRTSLHGAPLSLA